MKTAISTYPFAVYGETKTSKAGKEYTAISVRFVTKDQTGQKVSTYFNLLDERDLLVLANVCNRGFQIISEQKTLERFEKSENEPKVEQEQKQNDPPNDEIPW